MLALASAQAKASLSPRRTESWSVASDELGTAEGAQVYFSASRTDIDRVTPRAGAPTSPLVAWALLIAGILSTASAWRDRQPSTTADFTLFYVSAQQSPAKMYAQQPRANMNPPHFQLLLRPLTYLSLGEASILFRALNILCLCGCVWWLAQTSDERWNIADYGALLAWAPMASVISLNQLTWILWPLLLWTWWCWRRERWVSGAIGFGLALSFKPFLGVFLLWLLATRRWRTAIVSVVVAAAMLAIGLVVYGVDVSRAWIHALTEVTWTYAPMNASVHGILARALITSVSSSLSPDVAATFVAPLAAAAGIIIVVLTLVRTRRWTIDQSWLPLMVGALLASPLGWLYYIWWILPGTRPSKLLLESPLLWMPMAVTIMIEPSRWVALTLGSVYFWGLMTLWLIRVRSGQVTAGSAQAIAGRPDLV